MGLNVYWPVLDPMLVAFQVADMGKEALFAVEEVAGEASMYFWMVTVTVAGVTGTQ